MNTKIRYDLDSLELANGDFGYPITEKEVRQVGYCNQLQRIRTSYNEVADFQRLFYFPKIQL